MPAPRHIDRLMRRARALLRQDRALSGEPDRLHQLTLLMMLRLLDLRQLQEEARGEAPLIPAPYRWRDWSQGLDAERLLPFFSDEEAELPGGGRGPGLLHRLRSLDQDPRQRSLARLLEGVHNRSRDPHVLQNLLHLLDALPWDERDALGAVYEESLRRLPGAGGSAGEFYTPRPLLEAIVRAVDPKPGERVLDPACGSGGFLITAWRHQGFSKPPPRGVEAKPLPAILAGVNLLLRGAELDRVTRGDALDIDITEIEPDADVILVNPPFGGEEPPHVRARFPEHLQTSESALLFLLLVAARLRPGGRAAVIVPEGVLSGAGVGARVRAELLRRLRLRCLLRLPPGVFTPYTDIRSNVLFLEAPGPTTSIHVLIHQAPGERQRLRQPGYTQQHPLRAEELEPFARWLRAGEGPSEALGPQLEVPMEALSSEDFSLDLRPPAPHEEEAPPLASAREQVEDAERRARDALATLRALHPEAWPEVALGSLLERHRQPVEPEPDTLYCQLTVRLRGQGVTLRQRLRGAEIRTRPQHRARAGQLVLSRIDARQGAIGVVPDALDGALVTQDFPLFEVDARRALPDYLAIVLTSASALRALEQASGGTTNRRRVPLKQMLALPIPLPGLEGQRAAVAVWEAQQALLAAARAVEAQAEALSAQLDQTLMGLSTPR